MITRHMRTHSQRNKSKQKKVEFSADSGEELDEVVDEGNNWLTNKQPPDDNDDSNINKNNISISINEISSMNPKD